MNCILDRGAAENVTEEEISKKQSFDVNEIPLEMLAQKFGPQVYFDLDIVKKGLIEDVQNSAKEITSQIGYYSNLVAPGKTNITRAIMAYLPPKMLGFTKQFKLVILFYCIFKWVVPIHKWMDSLLRR